MSGRRYGEEEEEMGGGGRWETVVVALHFTVVGLWVSY